LIASHRNFAAAFLRHAGPLAVILAVVTGILGMHVMTGTLSMHFPAALTAATAGTVHAQSAAATGHTGHLAAGGPAADRPEAYGKGVVAPADSCSCSCSCSCSGDCTSLHTMTVSCIPSAKTGSLSAPMPGTAVFGKIRDPGAPGAAPVLYSYLPGGPSPGELSISRT
jgi:hypothetical protein